MSAVLQPQFDWPELGNSTAPITPVAYDLSDSSIVRDTSADQLKAMRRKGASFVVDPAKLFYPFSTPDAEASKWLSGISSYVASPNSSAGILAGSLAANSLSALNLATSSISAGSFAASAISAGSLVANSIFAGPSVGHFSTGKYPSISWFSVAEKVRFALLAASTVDPQPAWFSSVVTTAFELTQLPPGWNGHDAAPASTENALAGLRLLSKISPALATPPFLHPSPEGGLFLDIQLDERRMMVLVQDDIGAFWSSQDGYSPREFNLAHLKDEQEFVVALLGCIQEQQ